MRAQLEEAQHRYKEECVWNVLLRLESQEQVSYRCTTWSQSERILVGAGRRPTKMRRMRGMICADPRYEKHRPTTQGSAGVDGEVKHDQLPRRMQVPKRRQTLAWKQERPRKSREVCTGTLKCLHVTLAGHNAHNETARLCSYIMMCSRPNRGPKSCQQPPMLGTKTGGRPRDLDY